MIRRVDVTDTDGRRLAILMPEEVPDEMWRVGIPLGPPPLDTLGLPPDIEVALSNQLFHRGILTARDAERRAEEISAAIAATLRLSVQKIQQCYLIGDDVPE